MYFVDDRANVKDADIGNVAFIAPVAASEDDDEDNATINKWSKIRVKALKFNESTYFAYIVLAIIFIGSIILVNGYKYTFDTFLYIKAITLHDNRYSKMEFTHRNKERKTHKKTTRDKQRQHTE